MIDRSEEAFPNRRPVRGRSASRIYYVINLRFDENCISFTSHLAKDKLRHVHVSRIAATCNITSLSYRTLFSRLTVLRLRYQLHPLCARGEDEGLLTHTNKHPPRLEKKKKKKKMNMIHKISTKKTHTQKKITFLTLTEMICKFSSI